MISSADQVQIPIPPVKPSGSHSTGTGNLLTDCKQGVSFDSQITLLYLDTYYIRDRELTKENILECFDTRRIHRKNKYKL